MPHKPLLLATLLGLTGCGAASAAPEPAPSAPRVPDDCTQERDAIFADIAASRERACTADTDCRTLTSPRHFDHEYDDVAHVLDADALEARSRNHLDRCGTTVHHEDIGVIRVIEASCIQAHCAITETDLHLNE